MVRSGGGQGHRGHCHPGPGLCPCNKEQTRHAGLQVGAGGAQDCGAPSPGPSGAPHVRGSCRAILPAAQPRLLREAVIALGLLPQVVVLHALAHRPRAHLRNSARHLGPGPLHLPHSHPGRLAPPRAGRCAVAACRLRARAPASHWARPRPQTTSEHPPRPRRHRPRRETKQGQSPHPERTACTWAHTSAARVTGTPEEPALSTGCRSGPHQASRAWLRLHTSARDEGRHGAGCHLVKPHGAAWVVYPSGGSPAHGCSHDAGAPCWSQDEEDAGAQGGLGPRRGGGAANRAHTHCPVTRRGATASLGQRGGKRRARVVTGVGTRKSVQVRLCSRQPLQALA